MAQTIEAFVGTALDEAKISPLHRRVIGLIAAGYFFDVIDFTILGSLIPYIIKSGFTSPAEAAAIAAPPSLACASAPPAKANSATGSDGALSISSIYCCSASSPSSVRLRLT
jgi:hypothetical protein